MLHTTDFFQCKFLYIVQESGSSNMLTNKAPIKIEYIPNFQFHHVH